MRHIVDIVAFWAVVFVAIRVLAHFPDSLLARIVFSQQGPLPARGESRSDYLLRWSHYWCLWFVQALVVFASGWAALLWETSLIDSAAFLVFWAVVVPLLGGVALLGAVLTLASACWVRAHHSERKKSLHVAQA
jgi:hypothetical protein